MLKQLNTDFSYDIKKRFSKHYIKTLEFAAKFSFSVGREKIGIEQLFLALIYNKNNLSTYILKQEFNKKDISFDEFLENLKNPDQETPIVNEAILSQIAPNAWETLILNPQAQEIILDSFSIAKELESIYVGTEHMLLSILKFTNLEFVKKLEQYKINYDYLIEVIRKISSTPFNFARQSIKNMNGNPEGALEYFGTDITELAYYRKIPDLIGRESEVKEIQKYLLFKHKPNPLLVGPNGIGKTSLVYGFAHKIIKGQISEELRNKKIIKIKTDLLLSSGRIPGEVEKKFLAILKDAENRDNVILFFDDINSLFGSLYKGGLNLEELLKSFLLQDKISVIATISDDLYRLNIENDTTLKECFRVLEIEEPSIEETFKIMNRASAEMCNHYRIAIRDKALKTAVSLSDIHITDRYLPEKAINLIDEACAIQKVEQDQEFNKIFTLSTKLEETLKEKEFAIDNKDFEKANKLKIEQYNIEKQIEVLHTEKYNSKNTRKYSLDEEIIRKLISKWTNIPITTLTSGEKSSLLNLEKVLSKYIIGQEDAVQKVAYAVKRGRVGIIDKNRPWASFLFLGPTGVGKTELAKTLSKILFGDQKELIQVDMSEFMEMHSVSKLIGSPPGYIGFEQGGWLTEQVKKDPHSVILFDEIEKAHPDILNILLQLLEDGHLTDGKGQRISFTNTIIIMTSNIGAEKISEDKILGFRSQTENQIHELGENNHQTYKAGENTKLNDKGDKVEEDKNQIYGAGEKINQEDIKNDQLVNDAYESMKNNLDKELKKVLRPELLNRLDEIIIFKGITKSEAYKILYKLLDELKQRIKEKNINLELDKKSINFLLEKGYSTEYGVRPLRRVIQHNLENIIADFVLGNESSKKNSKIRKNQTATLNITLNDTNTKLEIEKVG